MELKKYRWSKVYEAAEEELIGQLQAKNIDAERWTCDPHEELAAKVQDYDKTLWCAEGSLVFLINGVRISVQTGDTLQIPAYTAHEAVVGMAGCVCYEFPKTILSAADPTT